MTKETQEERIVRVLKDKIEIEPYNRDWPLIFEAEKKILLSLLPVGLIYRIEHFGSTSVPGLAAKPIVDIMIGVASLEKTKLTAAVILENEGCDYFWRPSPGGETQPYYAWFIKRDACGRRLCHIHMIEEGFEMWDNLLFRDYLIKYPQTAKEYESLKLGLAARYAGDREAYTNGKSEFIMKITALAKAEFKDK